MNLRDFVAQGPAPQQWRHPFRIEIEGSAWTCACDLISLVLVKAELKVPAFRGSQDELSTISGWASAQPEGARKLSVAELLEWSGAPGTEEQPGVILGIQVDRNRLAKLIQFIKGDVSVWSGTKTVGIPSLIVDRGGVWRGVLAGYDEIGPEHPVFETPQADLFDLAMSAD